MKTHPSVRLALLFASAVLFTSCAPLVSHQVPFNEADFAAYRGSGSASIVGQARIAMRNDSVRYTDNDTIDLTPVTAYTTEIIQRRFARGENLETAPPGYFRYAHSTKTDGLGEFAFHNLAPGDYYIGTTVEWDDWNWNTDIDGALYRVDIHYVQPIYARVSVRNGQTVRVTDWTAGKKRVL